jgi:hypothetical protein
MPRILVLAIAPLFLALLSGCSASSSEPKTPDSATHTCPEGFEWDGTKCEKKRTIVVEQDQPPPPPPPPPSK